MTVDMADHEKQDVRWSDEPRQSTDISGRAEFANVVAARIDMCLDGQGSTVFGLVGPWGSGKTTLLTEVVSKLPDWNVVWFSPWSVSDFESITTEFVSALSEAFPSGTKVAKRLATYSRFGTPALKLIPVVGDAIATVTDEVISELTKRPAWHSEFDKLSSEIAEQHQRVLVIVDDVDRLDGEELRTLLRVVRLLGRFTNVHYLMAYDQATIDKTLISAGISSESSDFMEKIVQYPFEIPPTSKVVRRRWSKSVLDAVITADTRANADFADELEPVISVLAAGLETPRATERLREQMISLSTLISGAEVDVLDFTVLTWLRIAHHRVWDQIRSNPDDYLSWSEGDSEAIREGQMETVRGLVSGGRNRAVEDAVRLLFEPAGLAGAISSELAGRRWRLHTSRYFERYFQIGLPDDDVSERVIEGALSQLLDGRRGGEELEYVESVILGPDQERAVLALEIVLRMRRKSSTTSVAMLDFLSSIRDALVIDTADTSYRHSATDRWLARELFSALETNLESGNDLQSRFGKTSIVASAYVRKRDQDRDVNAIKSMYLDLADGWFEEMRKESLAATLTREELLLVTGFGIWLEPLRSHRGFLAERIANAADLAEVAKKYVYFNGWMGSEVEYDVVFREEDFRFATDGVDLKALVARMERDVDVPEYEVADRGDPHLSDMQTRDFAVRSLQGMQFE